jgi:hypothetical protein
MRECTCSHPERLHGCSGCRACGCEWFEQREPTSDELCGLLRLSLVRPQAERLEAHERTHECHVVDVSDGPCYECDREAQRG